MIMKMKLEKGIEPGTYEATLTRFEEMESKYGAAFKFIYVSDNDEEISELVNQKYSAKTKLGKRVSELLGELPEELDLSDLVGKRCRITLIEQPDSEFTKVSSVKRI